MSDLLGVMYFIVGGFVAGRVFVRLSPETERKEFYVLLIVTLLAWLGWPLAWGIMRASDAAAIKALGGMRDE